MQQVVPQVQDIVQILSILSHFPSTYRCESQMSQLGDLIPPLMMLSWTLEAPRILHMFLNQLATCVVKPVS